jgi:hypothetical protein
VQAVIAGEKDAATAMNEAQLEIESLLKEADSSSSAVQQRLGEGPASAGLSPRNCIPEVRNAHHMIVIQPP